MKLLRKKIITVISAALALIVCASFITVTAAAADITSLADAAAVVIYTNEGSYSSVNPNDNGAVSIGKVQWHAVRALNLLKTIVSMNDSQARSILGNALYNEIKTTSSNWSSRTFNSYEAKVVSALLDTTEGHLAQDDLAKSDIKSYIRHGIQLGITDEKALVYFADIENQAGYGGSAHIARNAAQKLGGYDFITLDSLHKAALDYYGGKYVSRRTATYNYCASLILDSGNSKIINSYNQTDTDENSCTLTFSVNSDSVTDAVVYVRASSSDNAKSYPCKISGRTASVTIKASDIKAGENNFSAKIMVFNSSSNEPVDVRENIIIKLSSSSSTAQRLIGDINFDGKITATDARLLLRYTAKLENLGSETLKYSDANKDGKITASDARLILRVSAKLDTIRQ